MRFTKRLLALSGAATMVAGLLTGVATAQTKGSHLHSHHAPITLDFPSWQENEPGYEQFWNSMVSEFERANSGVTIHFYEVDFTDYIPTMLTRFAAGDVPDIFELPARNMATFAAQHYLQPVDNELKHLGILTGSGKVNSDWSRGQAGLAIGGHYYGMLIQPQAYVLFYNSAILASHHMSVPKNITQLITDAKALTGNGQYGIAFPTASDPNMFNEVSIVVTGLGQSWVKGNGYNLTAPGVVAAVNDYRALARYAAPGLQTAQDRQVYFDGKAAFLLDGGFELSGIQQTATKAVAAATRMAPLPLPHQAGELSTSLQIAASLNPTKRNLVLKFFAQLASPKSQALLVKDTESPSPLLAADKKLPYASVQVAGANGGNVIPPVPWFNENFTNISTIIGDGVAQMLTSGQTTKAALAAIQSQLPAPGKS